MSRFEEKREKSREAIVEAALELFAEAGFEKTSIRMIAGKAGISLGLMYNYFSSKDELLREIFQRGQQDIRNSFGQVNAEKAAVTGSIERHIRLTVQILKERKKFWKLLHGIRMQSTVVKQLEKETQQENAFIQQQIVKNLQELQVKQPELEARLLFAAIDGMAQHFLLLDDYPIDDVAALLIEKYRQPK